jgi:pimeloyl-ACP methyl ester carboxylesterase
MQRRGFLKAGAVAPVILAPVPVAAQGSAHKPTWLVGRRFEEIVTEEFMVDATDPGVRLYVRNKHPRDVSQISPERILLYVHGATQPSESTFDLALDGMSWMDYIAQHGWDVYLMDFRGFGGSTRPAAMDQPPEKNPPIRRTEVAVRDIGSVVDFNRRRRSAQKIHLLAWSWGAEPAAAYAAEHRDQVSGLILYSPFWAAPEPRSAQAPAQPRGAYSTATMATARERLEKGAPNDRKDELMPQDWFATWSAATLATDPVGARQDPPVLRSPVLAYEDSNAFWNSDTPYYDPGKITVPP